MKVVLEIKASDGKLTYTADLSKMGESAKKLAGKIGAFFEETFEGVFTKEISPKEE